MVLNVKDFPDELHREAKIQAAILGISLKELIVRSVKDFLEKQKKI
jgi:predicted HicB family RNase H-like nuclease